jgi:thymidylate synthase ThyX
MKQPRRIYLLDTKKLNPETIAVTFAKTSRSPNSFKEIAAELSDERAADFHEKWVVGYGHSSVAEHAILHIAVENISRLAVESLESNRLASYTEKSTRYQIWEEENFFLPEEIRGSAVEEKYLETCKLLFKEYQSAFNQIREHYKKINKRQKDESEKTYSNRIFSCSADVCRYYLPTSSLANVGVSINARALEHMLRKMLSHPLSEVRQIGEEIKTESLENVPTLVKYADSNDYLFQISDAINKISSRVITRSSPDDAWCKCIGHNDDGIFQILAALFYRFSDLSFKEAYEQISHLSQLELESIVNTLLGNLGKHDIPIRELEYAQISFDLIIDQGAYYELKRHRMMTQTVKPFSPQLGYAIPRIFRETGLLEKYKIAMEKAKDTFHSIHKIYPHAAAYILPNAFNRRVILKMNLRSALHLVKLRSAPNAHFAMRRAAQRISEEIRNEFPLFAQYFTLGTNETWHTLENNFFLTTSYKEI